MSGDVRMRMTVIALLLSLSLCACSQTYDGKTNTIGIEAGDEFVITLEGNATTGYMWQLARPVDKRLIELVGSEYVPYKTGLAGGGGKSIWTFKAVRAGRSDIFLKYVRFWEKNNPPEIGRAHV